MVREACLEFLWAPNWDIHLKQTTEFSIITKFYWGKNTHKIALVAIKYVHYALVYKLKYLNV